MSYALLLFGAALSGWSVYAGGSLAGQIPLLVAVLYHMREAASRREAELLRSDLSQRLSSLEGALSDIPRQVAHLSEEMGKAQLSKGWRSV